MVLLYRNPLILRAFSKARGRGPRDSDFDALNALFEAWEGARQMYDVEIDLIRTNCGYAVPLRECAGERDMLTTWTANKGPGGIETYWETRNARTINGDPAYILDEPPA